MAPSGENLQQKRKTQCTELYAALRERGVHCLSFFAANFSGAAKTRDLRNYEGAVGRQSSAACVQRASTGIKTSGASEFRKGRPQRASEPNTKPGGVRVVCALRFFCEKYKEYQKVFFLPCKHHFHVDCILPWFEKNHICPTCRFDLNEGEKGFEIGAESD